MTTPKIVCRECGSEISPADKFCSVCGSRIEWQSGRPEAGASKPSPKAHEEQRGKRICPLCGHQNPPGSRSCVSCGAGLPSSVARDQRAGSGSKAPSGKGMPLNKFQSWKLIAGFGILLVAVLIVLRTTGQKSSSTDKLPPEHAAIVKSIEAFEKQLQENPNDANALLQLGNIYYDEKLFPRAIMMYERYLQLNPSNADARVDLGTSYFELALTDSTRRDEYFANAKRAIEKALEYSPKHQLACYNLGMVNLHTGDMEKASDWFKKCVEIDANSETGKRAQQIIKQQSMIHPPSS